MNRTERKQVAERIQRRNNNEIDRYHRLSYTPSDAHLDRTELLTALAAAEREIDGLRGYVSHADDCEYKVFYATQPCDCGLDELLNQQEMGS